MISEAATTLVIKGETGLGPNPSTQEVIRLDKFYNSPGSSGGDGCAKPRQSSTYDHYFGSLGDRFHEPEISQKLTVTNTEGKIALRPSNSMN